jgi:transcription elongation GreA/GreB family factor
MHHRTTVHGADLTEGIVSAGDAFCDDAYHNARRRIYRTLSGVQKQLGCCNSFSMSRAFIKEDVDPPERSGRKRSASGLPPGAANYITVRGAKCLRDELENLRATNAGNERVMELEHILASVHVVDPPDPASNCVAFGATVTVQDAKGVTETYSVLGVDEPDLEADAVSWISPIGKALLAADMGHSIRLADGRTAKIVKIERKNDT